MIDHMDEQVGQEAATDPLTIAIAEILRGAIKDQWKKFPTEGDFKVAAAKATGRSAETVARILRAETSLRVDYLFHYAELLGTTASAIMGEAERQVATAGGVPVTRSQTHFIPAGEFRTEYDRLVNEASRPDDTDHGNAAQGH